MSGESRRPGGWLLPVIVVAAGAYFLVTALQSGTLSAVSLKPVNWIGLALMVAGATVALVVREKKLYKLAGVVLCVAGAVMVIYL